VIASGGVGTLGHMYDGLVTAGASAALVASIFHYGTHTIREAKTYLTDRGVPMRALV
jgi:cyclase